MPGEVLGRRLCYPVREGEETIEARLLAEGYSKRLIVVLKQLPDGLTVAGERVYSTRLLQAGETLVVTLPADPPRSWRLALSVPVLLEDEDLIVYDKPAGLVCHRSGSHQQDTLENTAEGTFRAVNRLDRDTSGALVAAKHQLAAAKLWRQVDKSYLAVVSGRMPQQAGTIALPLRREHPYEPRQIADPDGLEALTCYEELCYALPSDTSLLRCRLMTGRMHQIRAHMAAMGHPLLGDALYGGDCTRILRHALHCEQVSFTHPITDHPMTLLASLPEDLETLLQGCGLSAVTRKVLSE